jgi:DNA-binding CsgD family transcriptional regulator
MSDVPSRAGFAGGFSTRDAGDAADFLSVFRDTRSARRCLALEARPPQAPGPRGRGCEGEGIVGSRILGRAISSGSSRRARTRTKRRAGDDALELWKALAAGRWSLVDHFERDGRRYVLARPNAPGWRRPRRLTSQERQAALGAAAGASNKVLAYDLGVPISTAATILSRALRKLGIRTRAELVGILRGRPWRQRKR